MRHVVPGEKVAEIHLKFANWSVIRDCRIAEWLVL